MKFLNHKKFLNVVNQWVRDGSNIVQIDSTPYLEQVILKGADGATEVLVYFYNENHYDESELDSMEEDDVEAHRDPTPEPVKENRTPAQTLVDATFDQVQKSRVELLRRLMEDPGALATFDPDYLVEFGDLAVEIKNDRLDVLNRLDIDVHHRITIRNRTHLEQLPDVDQKFVNRRVETIKRLRKDVENAQAEGDLKKVTDIRARISIAGLELSEKNLRLTEEGNLESV